MSGEDRAAEIRDLLFVPAEIPFRLTHRRIEELVGRSVYTHEMALAVDDLLEEARTWEHLSPMEQVLKSLSSLKATGKPVIVVGLPEKERD